MNVVPFGPCLSPGVRDDDEAETLREKLPIRGLKAAMAPQILPTTSEREPKDYDHGCTHITVRFP